MFSQPAASAVHHDAFGHAIDPTVGYARGTLLRASEDESRRLAHCERLATVRWRAQGAAAVRIFTGNRRNYPVQASDLGSVCEEWLGPALAADEFRHAALAHLGGGAAHGVGLLNRTSAGLIAAIHALCDGRPVVALSPAGGRAHASVARGAALAGVPLVEATQDGPWQAQLQGARPALVLMTPVTSNLDLIDDATLQQMIDGAHRAGAVALVDDAYGARVRPVLLDGTPALRLCADLVITNGDKAGLHGPRAGLLAGRDALVRRTMSRASEWGLEARAPLFAGVLRALQAFAPEHLRSEAAHGAALRAALVERLGDLAEPSLLGPILREEAVLGELAARAGRWPAIVPCEATAALAVLLLRDHGIVTANTHGQPGASAALRLKPVGTALADAGGPGAVAQAVADALDQLSAWVDQPRLIAGLLFGEAA